MPTEDAEKEARTWTQRTHETGGDRRITWWKDAKTLSTTLGVQSIEVRGDEKTGLEHALDETNQEMHGGDEDGDPPKDLEALDKEASQSETNVSAMAESTQEEECEGWLCDQRKMVYTWHRLEQGG